MPASLRGLVPVLIAIAVLAVLQLVVGGSPFFVYIASIVGVNVILAVSLNIVNGMTGQFSIGHAGFMAVGAYTAGKLSLLLKDLAISGLPGVVSDQVQFVGTLLAGGIAAAACGFMVGLPSLRLRGDYLAIVTLGFGEIIRVVVQNLEVFGRALGLSGIPQTSSFFAVWFCVFLVVLVARRILSGAPTDGASGPSAKTRWRPRRWGSTPPATRSGRSSSPPSGPGWRAGCSPTSYRSSTRARSPS